ncbi:MAG: hypothetical protein IKS99_03975 [Firmicutes bacterium]|nr:hypothetical protein [Bacillota bacterium]
MKNKLEFLNRIREPELGTSKAASILSTILVLMFGVCIGVFREAVHYFSTNSTIWWQDIVKDLEFDMVFEKLPVWFMLGLTVAVCSQRPLKAAINELVFFIGVIVGFHLLPKIFADAEVPESTSKWIMIAAISVPLAVVFWYSKSRSWGSIAFDCLILGVMGAYCFECGLVYFHFTDMLMDMFNIVIIVLTAIALATGVIQVVVSLIGGVIIAMALGPMIQMPL